MKFTILMEPYDPNVVYFQDSREYVFHFNFASEHLAPFVGMTVQQFNAATLFEENQQAILGTVILPPERGRFAASEFNEYGIQFVRQDTYSREQLRDLFFLVKAHVEAGLNVEAFYFPTYEQRSIAEMHRAWFASEGIPLGSPARWAQGNTCYAEGWTLGALKYFPASDIDAAYRDGLLEPADILLTDGIPAELPFVAGIISLVPSTPNSHVAILARTYGVPFVHLALTGDADRARALVGHRTIFSACMDDYGSADVRLIDIEETLDDALLGQILELKEPSALQIAPMAERGAYGVSTEELQLADVVYVGGKASNFSLLREVIPENSPRAIALTFDLWNAFLDQPLTSVPLLELAPGERMVFWADGDDDQGPTHVSFRLNKAGESIALYDVDGHTLIDSVHFASQADDFSYGRQTDGGDQWQAFAEPSPGAANSSHPAAVGPGIVINEFMAGNRETIEDPDEAGQYPDWIELYNASNTSITLNGMYLTDDVNEPTRWQIPQVTEAKTLRQELDQRLSPHHSYPPKDMQMLSRDLALVRRLLSDSPAIDFGATLRSAVLALLTDPNHGFDAYARLRFRSSTNVEDSEEFVGAGLYDSFSGCLADDLALNSDSACACDPNRNSGRSVFRAIRQVFASFYNDNAYLERVRHDVNEAEVGMAVLVHHSFPDEIELANGVATIEVRGERASVLLTFVSQQGAVSVTNPEGVAIPEEVTVTVLSSGSVVPARLQRSSSLVPLGGTVMTWRDDYHKLVDLLLRISHEFSQVTGKTEYVLDAEYKKVAPGGAVLPEGGLVVKQIREIPEPNQTANVAAFVINQPLDLTVFTGEFELFDQTDVFADHRLKSRWTLETGNMPLDRDHLRAGLYSEVQIEILDEDRIDEIAGPMTLLPAVTHSYEDGTSVDTWHWFDLENPRTCQLETAGIPSVVTAAQNPIFIPADFGAYAFNLPYRCLTLHVDYEHPVCSWHQQLWSPGPPSGLRTTVSNTVHLWSPPAPSTRDVFQERSVALEGVSIRTSFYFPPPPIGFPDWRAHTAPLLRWGQTVIEGLTTEPIVLEGYYSQTYRPEHHNQIESFLFEPRLEPELPTDLVGQLTDLNIRLVHLVVDNQGNGSQSRIETYGFDAPP
ncbi:MAG: hypothetical protein JSW27_16990 [Phycisphaerales bacterium]|nr:MAG: hypothetical protein JSW27_16990 [Phycisphaerales bacterium]